jgi:hypothetical protein
MLPTHFKSAEILGFLLVAEYYYCDCRSVGSALYKGLFLSVKHEVADFLPRRTNTRHLCSPSSHELLKRNAIIWAHPTQF